MSSAPPPRRTPAFYRAVLEAVAPRYTYRREEARTRRVEVAAAAPAERPTQPPRDPEGYARLVERERQIKIG